MREYNGRVMELMKLVRDKNKNIFEASQEVIDMIYSEKMETIKEIKKSFNK
jgi:hypothetical protein